MATAVYVQYSGLWSLSSVANGQALGTWATQPIVGILYGWGVNGSGQIGDGTRTNRSSPVQVGSNAWKAINKGYGSTLAVRLDGTLWSWGNNSYGQLGLGTSGVGTYKSSPTQVGALTNWSSTASGQAYALAIKNDGTLWGWGDNSTGQLGTGGVSSSNSPVQIGALTTWASVATDSLTGSFAIKTDGTLWSWGGNSYGGLGLGNTTNYSSPKQVGALTNWLRIAGGRYCAFAIKTDGTLWSWGYGASGRLGLGNSTYYSSPKQIGLLTTWASVGGGGAQGFAIKTDGTLWSWGYNGQGTLGLGNRTNYSSPKQVGALTNWLKVAGSGYATAAVKTDGTLWTWGQNDVGQLGLGTSGAGTYKSSPTQVGSATSWVLISGLGYPGATPGFAAAG